MRRQGLPLPPPRCNACRPPTSTTIVPHAQGRSSESFAIASPTLFKSLKPCSTPAPHPVLKGRRNAPWAGRSGQTTLRRAPDPRRRARYIKAGVEPFADQADATCTRGGDPSSDANVGDRQAHACDRLGDGPQPHMDQAHHRQAHRQQAVELARRLGQWAYEPRSVLTITVGSGGIWARRACNKVIHSGFQACRTSAEVDRRSHGDRAARDRRRSRGKMVKRSPRLVASRATARRGCWPILQDPGHAAGSSQVPDIALASLIARLDFGVGLVELLVPRALMVEKLSSFG